MSLFPHLTRVLADAAQTPVLWVYVGLFVFAAVNTWLCLQVALLPPGKRRPFYSRFFPLSDCTTNLCVLFGVMGTLAAVGLAVAQTTMHGELSRAAFSQAISSGFSAAILTTIAGGLLYGYCYLLSAFSHLLLESSEEEIP